MDNKPKHPGARPGEMTEADALWERIDELEAELTVYRLMAAMAVATIVAAAAVGVMA